MFSSDNKKQGLLFFAIVFIFAGTFLFADGVRGENGEEEEEETTRCLDWSSYISNADPEDPDSFQDIIQKCKDEFDGEGRTYSWYYIQQNNYCYDKKSSDTEFEGYCCPLFPSICCAWHNDGCGQNCELTAMHQTCTGPTDCLEENCTAGDTQCFNNYPSCLGSLPYTPPSPPLLAAPTIIYPKNNSEVYAGEFELKWSNTWANFYKYSVQGNGEIKEEKIIGNYLSKKIYGLELGNYSWAVCSCSSASGENCICSSLANFQIVPVPPEFLGGLVPCGRKYDDPNTPLPINESAPCEYKHIFLLFNNVLNFILWRLGLIVLVLLILTIGMVSYFSMGSPSTMAKVKSVLRSAGIGYGIMFLAWIFINLILSLLGYQINIFGHWWQIPF